MWIWQHKQWPKFFWDNSQINNELASVRLTQGRLLGITQHIDKKIKEKLSLDSLASEAMTTSAIEGELLDRESVRSSIAFRLGIEGMNLHHGNARSGNRYIEGLLDILLDATNNHQEQLTLEKLNAWHAGLFPTGYSGIQKICVGQPRQEGVMQIISGRPGKTTLHFEAPPFAQLGQELNLFLNWFNQDSLSLDGIVRAGIAHLWFEIIHPYDDGNGRLGRAVAEMALAQDEQETKHYYSLSHEVMQQRKQYYSILGQTTSGGLDITAWLEWFLMAVNNAILHSLEAVELVLQKTKFWRLHQETEINRRQQKVIARMLDEGIDGFQGGMTTKKYMHLTKASRATAYRELKDLVDKKYLEPTGNKGRSSSYQIFWEQS